jgi:Xaa-Pro aminopeptidase
MRENRVEKVLALLRMTDLDACLVKGMDNIYYLSGFRGSEGTLLITKGDVYLLTDFRYITYAQEVTQGIKIIEVRDKKNILGEICSHHGIQKIGFDSIHTPFSVYKKWSEALDGIHLVPLENPVEEIRKIKEPEEIDKIVKAIDVATKAFAEIFEKIRPGQTEKDIANDLEYTMRRFGAEGPSFPTIVASGPRAALPHAEPSDKEIQSGEMVIIDFGAQVNGYCSDETCTLSIGEVNGKMQDIYTVVSNAKKLALERTRVGVPIKEVDMMVRGSIDEAGYGEFFRHGTGHGVGIAVHETPSINSTSDGILEEGMVITIEPGIYLPNIGGVRLEDMVLITADSPRLLTRIRKDELHIKV